ncbi:MAG: hypothetical protein AAF236_13070, partial [Verrucomicrobiota bacterium]
MKNQTLISKLSGLSLLWGGAGILGTLSEVSAEPVPIVNHSFELDAAGNPGSGEFELPEPFGWNLYVNSPGLIDSGYYVYGDHYYVGSLQTDLGTWFTDPTPDGERALLLYNTDEWEAIDTDQPGVLDFWGVEQHVDTVLEANTAYTFSVEIGNIASGATQPTTQAALKLARQYWIEKGEPSRGKIISRDMAYHGNTLG